MLKFLLIVFLLSYAIYRVGGFLFKILTLGGGAQSPQRKATRKRPDGGNVNIDYVPGKKDRKPYKGGDYVDFEELS